MDDLKIVELPFGKTIYQTGQGQGISSDTQFLIDTVLNEEPSYKRILELGSGNGIISIMLKHYRPLWEIKAIEIQSYLAELSKKNAEKAEVEIEFSNKDLRSFRSSETFDIIISNPPYIPINAGRISPNRERAISRQEIKCTMNDIVKALSKLLAPEGCAYLMYPQNRMDELIRLTKKVDLKVVSRFISKTNTKGVFVGKIKQGF